MFSLASAAQLKERKVSPQSDNFAVVAPTFSYFQILPLRSCTVSVPGTLAVLQVLTKLLNIPLLSARSHGGASRPFLHL